MLEQPLDFTVCSSIQFFNLCPSLIHPPSPNTVSEAARGYLPITVQRLHAMPRGWQVF